jgi:hypothetical protein
MLCSGRDVGRVIALHGHLDLFARKQTTSTVNENYSQPFLRIRVCFQKDVDSSFLAFSVARYTINQFVTMGELYYVGQ